MKYTRAYVERSADDDGPIRFIAATEGRKADGIDLRMSGAQLDRFRANPVFLYGHRQFTREDLPIGKGEGVTVDSDRLLIDVAFDQEDDFARKVERKYRGGFLNAVSVGFEVREWEGSGSHWNGGVATEWELLELSAVPVPMDDKAIALAGRMLDMPEGMNVSHDFELELLNELVNGTEPSLIEQAIARVLERRGLKLPPVPEVEKEPAPSGVDLNAARSLLAVFESKENS